LYPLGLFIVALQLHSDEAIDLNFVNAWYASSLVSSVVIAGHGARAFLWPLALSAGVSLITAKALYWGWGGRNDMRAVLVRSLRTVQAREEWILRAAVALVFGLAITFVFADGTDANNLFIVPTCIGAGIAGGILIFILHGNSKHRREMRLTRGVGEGWILWGLALAYGVGLLAVFLTAFFVESKPLPEVNIRGVNGKAPESNRDGWLLSHNSGYWYVVPRPPETASSGFDGGGSRGGGGGVEWSVLYSERYCYLSSRANSPENACPTQPGVRPTATATASTSATASATASAKPKPKPEPDPKPKPEPNGVGSSGGEPDGINQPAQVVTVDPAECLKEDRQICAIPDGAVGYAIVKERR
jgi:hypothetical protein